VFTAWAASAAAPKVMPVCPNISISGITLSV
jgi:hypothetical protein